MPSLLAQRPKGGRGFDFNRRGARSLVTAYLILAVGLAMLLLSGDALVRGAVALSVRLHIPALVIGLTVVAFGTSAPELVVSIRAALAGSPDIALGNVVGSNIANILLVLGLPAMLAATDCNQPFIRRNALYVTGASILFIILCYLGPLSFFHGLLLFTLLVLFLIEQAKRAEKHKDLKAVLGEEAVEMIDGVAWVPHKIWKTLGIIAIGLVGLPIGATLTVNGASEIARQFAVPEAVIGLSIVALGTSLPELATTLPAAIRGHAGLALGNILGSNLFNLLAVMGVTAMITPVPVSDEFFQIHLWVMLAAALILLPFILPRGRITRLPAALFVAAYLVYIYFAYAPPEGSFSAPLQASPAQTK